MIKNHREGVHRDSYIIAMQWRDFFSLSLSSSFPKYMWCKQCSAFFVPTQINCFLGSVINVKC